MTRLNDLIEDVELDPATIANGAVELLNEVSSSKVTGEEERYSHLDLIDFAANLSGSKNAFEAVRPLLASKDSAAADDIAKKFDAAQAALDKYKSGTGYVAYGQLSKDDTKKLAQSIDAVAEPLSKVAKKVAS